MLMGSYERGLAWVWPAGFLFVTLSAAITKEVFRSRPRIVSIGLLVLVIYAVSMATASAEIFDQRLVDSGRQVATVAIQFPVGWQKVVDPQNDQLNVFASGPGSWCGLQMNRQVAYQAVSEATTVDKSFPSFWDTMLRGQQVLQMGPSKYWNTVGGSVVYAGTAIVNSGRCRNELWVIFGGRSFRRTHQRVLSLQQWSNGCVCITSGGSYPKLGSH